MTYVPLILMWAVLIMWGLIAIHYMTNALSTRSPASAFAGVGLLTFIVLSPSVLDPAYSHGLSSSQAPILAVTWELSKAVLYLIAIAVALTALLGKLRMPRIGIALSAVWLAVALPSLILGQSLETMMLLLALFIFVLNAELSTERFIAMSRWALRLATVTSVGMWIVAPDLALQSVSGESRTLLGFGQLSGATGHPNALGPLAAFSLVIEIATFKSRTFSGPALIAAILCLAFAQSRGGWAIAVVGVTLLWIYSERVPGGRALRILFAVASSASVALILFLEFASTNMDFSNGRLYIWNTLLVLFNESPLIGRGVEVLSPENRADFDDRLIADAVGQAHNQFVQTLISSGLIGMFALLVFIAIMFTSASRLQSRWKPLAMASSGMLFVEMIVESPMVPSFSVFALILLFVTGLVSGTSKSISEYAVPDRKPIGLV